MTEPMDGTFYAKGRVIHRSPIEKVRPDGRTSISVGFPVCEVSEYLNENAAQKLADILNAHDPMLAALKAAREMLEEYENAATGEHFNSTQINDAIAKAEQVQ
jgi:hypothetical protein